jgi:ABC-type nitrate/sulfonate/bicarbonate transport system substrate-binding protein
MLFVQTVGCALFLVAGWSQPLPSEKVVRVGYLPATHDSLLFIALEQKLFPSWLKVEATREGVSPDILNKMRSENVDIGIPGVASPIYFIGGGSPFVIVGGAAKKSAAVVVRKELLARFKGKTGEELLQAFAGLRIGSFKQSTGDAIFRMRTKVRGIDVILQDSYQQARDILTDIRTNRLDGAVLWSPHMSTMESEEVAYIVLWLDELLPDHVCCRQVVREEFLRHNEDAVVAYLQGLIRAMVFYQDPANKPAVLEAVRKYVQTPAEIVEKELYDSAKERKRTTLSVDLDQSGIEAYQDAMQAAGLIDAAENKRVRSRTIPAVMVKAYRNLGLSAAEAEQAVRSGFAANRDRIERAIKERAP